MKKTTKPKPSARTIPQSSASLIGPDAYAEGELLMRGYLPHHLSRLMNLMNIQLLEVLRPLDVSGQQFRVMQVIDARGIANVGQIARDAVIEQSLVSRVVDQLEKRGLASRRKHPGNARIVEVSMTPRGREVYATITPYRIAIVDDAVSVLDESERRMLEELLDRMFRHLSRPRAMLSVRPTGRSGRHGKP